MSKGGISLNSFAFPKLAVQTLVSPEAAAKVYQQFAQPDVKADAATPSGPQASCGPATDPLLAQVWAAAHSAAKAALIGAYLARNYQRAHDTNCPVPQPVIEPKPPLVDNCRPPVLAEKRYVGDELVRQLDAGGAAIGGSNGAYGVQSGRDCELPGEIDPGESLTFHVPNGGRAASGQVTIDKLFNAGPDGNRQEQGVVEVYDGGHLVKTIVIRGYSATNGQQTVEVDVPFTRLVFKATGEYRGHGNGSDFAVSGVTVRQWNDAPPIQPLPQPYPQPYPQEPYIGIPWFGSDVIVPVSPPALPYYPFAVPYARSLGRLAEIIDRSRLPENVQNALLDRIATLLAEIRQAPPNGGHHGTTILVGIASLIGILENSVPHPVSRKLGHGGKGHVMDHLKTMLFSAALGRGEVANGTSKVA
jgi:hypothetical protein